MDNTGSHCGNVGRTYKCCDGFAPIMSNLGAEGLMAVPKIGVRVYVGAGAKILGSVIIESDAVVGANAVVTKDVPAGATIVCANRILPANNPVAEH